MECSKRFQLLTLLNILSFSIVALPGVLLMALAKPVDRGFFCGDTSISYPYKRDSVSGMNLFLGGVVFPVFCFAVLEAIRFLFLVRSDPKSTCRGTSSLRVSCIPGFLAPFFKVLGVFLFGLSVQFTIFTVAKYSVGRLRPHFLSVCLPNEAILNCTYTGGHQVNEENRVVSSVVYLDGNVCSRPYDRKLANARMSFPSGHASIATYAAGFLIMYLEWQTAWMFCHLLRRCIQTLLLCLAAYVSVSRISDNMHHPGDVVAGSVVGVFVALLSVLYLLEMFKARQSITTTQITSKEMKPLEEGQRPTTDVVDQ